jgi:hypothetical protein
MNITPIHIIIVIGLLYIVLGPGFFGGGGGIEGLNANASMEEKLLDIIDRMVKGNKKYSDFEIEITEHGLDSTRFGLRAFGLLATDRLAKGETMTVEDIKASITEHGI